MLDHRTPDHPTIEPPPPEAGEVIVRAAMPGDRQQVNRLLHEGLLPGHMDYESSEADRIRESLGSARDAFFVAEAGGQIVGSIAVVEGRQDVGFIHWLRVAPTWQNGYKIAQRLAEAAATHAREVGLLKLVLHAPNGAEDRVASYYRQMGFEFSRARQRDGRNVLEFYLNLYQRPRRNRRA